MRRILSVFLALALVFSLFALIGCENEEADPSASPTQAQTQNPDPSTDPDPGTDGGPTQEELESSLPNEYIKEKVEAGMKPTVAFCTPSLSSELMVALDAGMKESLEANGFSYVSSSFNADSALQLQQCENYIEMGVCALISLVFDAGFQDMANKIMDSGIYLIYWSSIPTYPITLSLYANVLELGAAVGKMADAWVEQQYPDAGPGEIKAAIFRNNMNEQFLARSQATEDALLVNEKVDIAYYYERAEMTVSDGYNFAEEALTYDSDIRVFLCLTSGAAMGVSNYLETLGITNLVDYACFAGDADPTAKGIIDQVKANPSSGVLRGYATSGGENVYDFPLESLYKLFYGEIEPGSVAYEPVYTYDAIGFDYYYVP